MNILTALFGRKKFPESSIQSEQSINRYLANTLSSVNACTSVLELTEYVRDYSGYVREAAINRCVKLALPELLTVVASRLNDWVPEVRHAARAAVITIMPFVPASRLLATLPAILKLLDTGRANHAAWVEQFEKNLILLVDAQEIIEAARGTDIKLARACFHLLKKYSLLDSASLIHMILSTREDIVLAIQAVQLCAGMPPEERSVHYSKAMHSHFGAVRTIALQALLAQENEAKKIDVAVAALFDVQSSVRSLAMTYLQAQDFDLRTHYRNAILLPQQSAKRIQVGIMSLSSLRNVADISFIRAFTKSERPSIRLAALAAWLKLAESDKDLIAMDALQDEASSIRKFALQAERKHGAYIPFSDIRTNLEHRGDFRLLLLFSESRKWDWLECIARASRQITSDDTLKPHLVSGLRDWLLRAGNMYAAPRPEQLEFLVSEHTISDLHKLLGHDERQMKRLALELSWEKASR
ncbi:MAG: hypothetical protein V4634_03805 [Pseudomonadota bacterium]